MKKTHCLLAVLVAVFATFSLSGKDFVTKMAVKRGQQVVNPDVLPLACITVVLDHAALPLNQMIFDACDTKDIWIAKVGTLVASHPKVLTAMQGDHRSLTMLIVHLDPGWYQFYSMDFEGVHIGSEDNKGFRFYVKPGCVNYVGSFVISTTSAAWDALTYQRQLAGMVTAEPTAHRDRKWATDVVPGLASLPAKESAISMDEPNQISEVNGQVKR